MISYSYRKIKISQKIIICLTLFIAFCGWSSINLNWSGWGSIQAFYMGTFLFCLSIIYRKRIGSGEMTSVVHWTLLSACLSIIPAFLDWDATFRSFLYGFITTYYGFSFYYLLRIWKVNPDELMKIICLFSLIWVAIEIGQQFTYPQYWFLGRRNEYDYVENRMGLWRFYIWGVDFVMLAFSYYAGRFLSGKKNTIKTILLAVIFAVGILCYCSRKHIIAILAVSLYAFLKVESKHKWKIRLAYLCLIVLLVFNFYGEYTQMSAEQDAAQGTGEEFIRYLSALFFLNDFSSSILYPIFGTGWGSVELYSRLQYYIETFRFYRSDIGLLGYYSTVGITGVSAILFYIFKFVKRWRYIDLEYKLFFMMKMFLIIFDFWMSWAIGIIAYGTFLYLLDENIEKNKLLKDKAI